MNVVVHPTRNKGKQAWTFQLDGRQYEFPLDLLGNEEFPEHNNVEVTLKNVYVDIHHKQIMFDHNDKRIAARQQF